MSSVSYRRLLRDELSLLHELDRSERIDAAYRVREGRLEAYPVVLEVNGWDPGQADEYVEQLQALYDAAGVVLGAWDDARLVGLAALDVRGVGGDMQTFKLEMLYVSAAFRNQGIGRALTQRLADEARSRGASALYISATPTRNTVDAYLRLGARLLDAPDPELIAREPEDVHLLMKLR